MFGTSFEEIGEESLSGDDEKTILRDDTGGAKEDLR